jgi:hypothetical protein
VILALALLAAAADPQLSSAFRAAFGKTGSVTFKRQGQMEETVKYTPGALVQAPFGPVLLSVGKVLEPAHASSGKLAAVYLKRTPRGFRVLKRFVPATESGSFGTIEDWKVSRAYGKLPVVEVSGGGTWQGYTCSVTTLLELAPGTPRELVTVALYYDDSGTIAQGGKPTTIVGRIGHIVPGRSFDVVYTGPKHFTERYVRRGNTYVLPNHAETRMPLC